MVRLALGEAGESPLRLWPLAAGIALGVGSWVFFSGFAVGLGQLLQEKVAGSLPDRVRVTASSTSLGPIQLEKGLTEETVQACRAIPGVLEVYRQAHFPGPAQLSANYGGQSVYTDIVVEGVDPGQVADQLSDPAAFSDPGDSLKVPAVIPEAVLDAINTGISAHTSLPTLSPSALTGRHFDLYLGISSYQRNAPHTDIRCKIVGVSDQLGISGPAIPLSWVERHAKKPLRYHTLTLKLRKDQPLEPVLAEVRRLGLVAPGIETAARINSLITLVQLATAAFSGCILLLAGVSISTGMALQIRQERWLLGLFRAVGATQRDILHFILARSALLSSSGSLVGIGLGWSGGLLADQLLRQHITGLVIRSKLFQPTLTSWLFALACGVLAGVASGWWPARQAALLPPSEALRGD